MTVLDAFAVIALFKAEPAAGQVRGLIEGGGCALTTIGVAEVVDHLVRLVGVCDEDAVLDVAQLGLDPAIELNGGAAVQAALLRAWHYSKRRQVSLGDCVAAAAARIGQRSVATSDPHLLDLCHDEGIAMIPLPDSSGSLWSA